MSKSVEPCALVTTSVWVKLDALSMFSAIQISSKVGWIMIRVSNHAGTVCLSFLHHHKHLLHFERPNLLVRQLLNVSKQLFHGETHFLELLLNVVVVRFPTEVTQAQLARGLCNELTVIAKLQVLQHIWQTEGPSHWISHAFELLKDLASD